MSNYISNLEEFNQFLMDSGYKVDNEDLTPNETNIVRFQTQLDQESKRSGYAILFIDDDEIEAAQYGDWHDEEKKFFWFRNGNKPSSEELKQLAQKIENNRESRFAQLNELHAETAIKCQHIWNRSSIEANNHPYLTKKKVQAHGIKLDPRTESLAIPLNDADGNISTLQFIDKDGRKILKKGGKAQGAHLKIKGNDDVILISEGYATAATLFEATGFTSIMAVNCGNMLPVASLIKKQHQDSTIIICADNDCYKDEKKNPGVENAISIKEKINCLVCIPRFKDVTSKPTDFNDLANIEGIDEVKNQINAVLILDGIPGDFIYKNGAIYHQKLLKSPDGNPSIISNKLCSHLLVTALTRTENSDAWGRLLEIIDQDNRKHYITMTMETLATDNGAWLSELLSKGLIPYGDIRMIKSYLLQCKPKRRLLCANKVGWHNLTYLTKSGAIGLNKNDIIYQDSQSNELGNTGFIKSGTLAEWQNNLSTLCINNSRLLHAVNTAFGSIVLPFLFGESGGFHFRCGSSRGKTTILQLAQSVMSSGAQLARWRATANGLEGIAAAHNHSLLVLDELSQLAEINPKTAGEAVYMLGNGEGKQRSKQNGSLAKRVNWQLLFLSAGEVSLAGILEQAGITERGGQSVRFIDIPADAGKGLGVFDVINAYEDGNLMAQAIKRNSCKYFGTAAEAFVNILSSNIEDCINKLTTLVNDFIESLQLEQTVDPQVLRVAHRFAIVAAAGELATELKITQWPIGQASWGSRTCFSSWLMQRGSTGSQESEVILSTLRDRLVQWNSKIQNLNGFESSPFEVWGYRDGANDYFMLPKAFREHICNGLEIREVEKTLRDKRLLITNNGTSTTVKKIFGSALRVYHIKKQILDATSDEQTTPEIAA